MRTNLTKNQFLTWASGKLNPDLPVYNLPVAFVIAGQVDRLRFQSAFQSLVDQADALRTVLDEIDGLPRQRVLPQLGDTLELLDFCSAAEPRAAALAWVRGRSQVPLDIAVRPFEAALLKLADDRYIWYFNQHHLVADGWSAVLAFEYTATLYQRLGESGTAGTLELPQFQDLVARERENYGSEAYRRSKAYWQAKLAEDLEPLAFYGATAAKRSTRVERVTFPLDAERSANMRKLAQRGHPALRGPQASLPNLFGAAFVAYLHRLGGQARVRLATPLLNRPTVPSKKALGLFAQMTPLSVPIAAGDTFVSLAGKFHAEMVASRRHRHYTTDNPVDRRAYDVMFNYHVSVFTRFCQWPVETEWFFPGYEHDSLALQVQDFDERGTFELNFDFHADVFSPEDRNRALRHFLRVLDELCRDPEQHWTDFAGSLRRKNGNCWPTSTSRRRCADRRDDSPRTGGTSGAYSGRDRRRLRRRAVDVRPAPRPRKPTGELPPPGRLPPGDAGRHLPGALNGVGGVPVGRAEGGRDLRADRPRLPPGTVGRHAGGCQDAGAADHAVSVTAAAAVRRSHDLPGFGGDRGRGQRRCTARRGRSGAPHLCHFHLWVHRPAEAGRRAARRLCQPHGLVPGRVRHRRPRIACWSYRRSIST